ncbi:MAG: hypothetical protein ACM3XO_11500 [Bacteroidota bacterium]
MQNIFIKMVQQYFEFLLKDFEFTLISAIDSPRGENWEGNVQYVSKTTYIEISSTRGENPSLWIGRTKDKEKHLLPMQIIYEYMNLSDNEKKIVLSVSEGKQASSILSKKQLLYQVPTLDSIEERKKLQIEIYARSLRQSGLSFLVGDFSQWLEIWEYHFTKLTVENTRAGRSEFVPIVVNDENGKLKIIGKQYLFEKTITYIAELKKEQGDLLDT